MNNIGVPADIQRQLLERKLQVWHNTLYDAQLDARVAEALDDQQIKDQAIDRMKRAHKAIDFLKSLIEQEGAANETN